MSAMHAWCASVEAAPAGETIVLMDSFSRCGSGLDLDVTREADGRFRATGRDINVWQAATHKRADLAISRVLQVVLAGKIDR